MPTKSIQNQTICVAQLRSVFKTAIQLRQSRETLDANIGCVTSDILSKDYPVAMSCYIRGYLEASLTRLVSDHMSLLVRVAPGLYEPINYSNANWNDNANLVLVWNLEDATDTVTEFGTPY